MPVKTHFHNWIKSYLMFEEEARVHVRSQVRGVRVQSQVLSQLICDSGPSHICRVTQIHRSALNLLESPGPAGYLLRCSGVYVTQITVIVSGEQKPNVRFICIFGLTHCSFYKCGSTLVQGQNL